MDTATFYQIINLAIVYLVAFCVLLSFIALLVWSLFLWIRWHDRENQSLDSVLLHIAVPRDNEIKIDAMEQLFAAFFSIKKSGWKQRFKPQPQIAFEIVAKPEDIRFFVWTPRKFKDLIEKQIHGAYPDADIHEVEEYNLFTPEGEVAYAALQLRSDNYLPIKVYKELPTDPLSAITTALSKMQPGEAAAIQVLISPADSTWKKHGKAYISSTKKSEADPEKAKFNIDAKTLEAINSKLAKPGFEVSIRIVVASSNQEAAKAHLTNIRSTFEQFSSEQNGFSSRKVRYHQGFMTDFLYRYHPIINFGKNHKSVLNSEEMATIFHFPNKLVETPHIVWLNAKRAPAPAQIPNQGLHLGRNIFRGVTRDIYINEDDRRRHMYIVGRTGTGKSELLKHMVKQDILAGKGVCFIDPHGDAVEDILNYIPPERAEDVIFFNPNDYDRPVGINLLEAENEEQQHFVATSIVNLMYKLYDPYKTGIVGPRFEHGIRNAMLTVMQAQPGGSFVEVVQTMTRPDYVQELLPHITDPMVRRYWTDQIAQTADFHKSEVLDYTVSKFGRFVTNKMMRNIIGQSKSSFDLRKVMDEGKILLIKIAKGDIGEENSSFLGLILVPRILMAALSRQNMPEENRRDFYLYVDEFQNFATPDFAQILSEARKYRLNLCVANQFIGQVDEEVKNAVFGNVGTLMSFRIGVQDASYLAHEFTPTFDERDLLNIEKYNVYIKTTVSNEPVPPFSLDVWRDLKEEKKLANPQLASQLKELSRLKYGRPKEVVEAEIIRRSRL